MTNSFPSFVSLTPFRIVIYRVPVLFATSEGLHLRLADENYSGFTEKEVYLNESIKSQWAVQPEFITEFCDLQVCLYAF